MSDQNESKEEHSNMSPKSGKDDKSSSTGPATITTDTVEEDLNGIVSIFDIRTIVY